MKWVVAGKLIIDNSIEIDGVSMDIRMCPNASIDITNDIGSLITSFFQPTTGTIQSNSAFKWSGINIIGSKIFRVSFSNITLKDADIAISKNGSSQVDIGDCTFSNNRIGVLCFSDNTGVNNCTFKGDAFVKGTLTWPEVGIKTVGSNQLSINNATTKITTFEKLRYGILADGWARLKTTGIIRFQNIDAWTSSSTTARAPDAGIGLYLKHGARMTEAYSNTISTAQIFVEGGYKGVVVNNATANIQLLTSQDWNGVQTTQPLTFLSCRDKINTINSNIIGAGLVLLSDNTMGSISLNNNAFNNAELSITNMSAAGTPAAYSVTGNVFNINTGLGLRISGVNSAANKTLIKDNRFYTTPTITNYGVILQNSSNITFEHNAIKNATGTTFTIPTGIQPISPQTGIYAFNVKSSSISCNDITGIRTGIALFGAQNNNKIETNQFGTHWLGIAYGATALTLPVQALTAGNRFANNAADMTRSAWNQTSEVSPAPNIWAGQLYGNPNNTTYYPPKQWAGSTTPTAYTWFNPTTNPPNTCTYQPALVATSSDFANEMAVATGQRSASVYSDEVQYLAQKDLYEAAMKDPSLTAQYPDLQILVDSLALTPMAEFVNFEADAKEQPVAYDALKLQLTQYQTQLDNISAQLETAAAAGDDVAVATWKQLYSTTEAAFETAQQDAENLFYQKASELRSANNLIAPTKLQEINQKTVNNLYLQTFAKQSQQISGNEKTLLVYIAAQCPYTGGNAVFEARDMLQVLGSTTNYDDLAICKEQGVSLRVKKPKPLNSSKSDFVRLYPNPAHDYFIIESDLTESSIQIIDVLGRNVLPIQVLHNRQTIATNQIPEGVYQVLVSNLSNEILHIQKIIVIN